MKKQWVPILILVWLVLLTVCMVLFQMRTGTIDEILDEQDRQAGILIKQSEILALKTVLVRALVEQVRSDRETAKDEVALSLEELPQEQMIRKAEDRPALLRIPSGDRHPECVIKEHLRKGVSL